MFVESASLQVPAKLAGPGVFFDKLAVLDTQVGAQASDVGGLNFHGKAPAAFAALGAGRFGGGQGISAVFERIGG